MNESQQRAALRQLADKLARQEQAIQATKAMIELIQGVPLDRQTAKK